MPCPLAVQTNSGGSAMPNQRIAVWHRLHAILSFAISRIPSKRSDVYTTDKQPANHISQRLHHRQRPILNASLPALPTIQHQRTRLEPYLFIEAPAARIRPYHTQMNPNRTLVSQRIEQSINQNRPPSLPLILRQYINMHMRRVSLQLLRPSLQRTTLSVIKRTPKTSALFLLHQSVSSLNIRLQNVLRVHCRRKFVPPSFRKICGVGGSNAVTYGSAVAVVEHETG
jgi:hypothetical protein